MKWRCEWCGKPQERNDPPCDNCGHHSFEKAVVPLAPEGDGGPIEWVCTECGRSHPRHNPPCSRCGNTNLEKREQTGDDDPLAPEASGSKSVEDDEPGDAPADDAGTTVWACEECGRAHPRNSPPCSRCGHMKLERKVQQFDDIGSSGGGWLDALELKYALGFLGAFLFLGLILASTMGVIDLGIGGPPTVDDVPGNDTTVGDLSLADVERAYVEELNDRRAAEGEDTLDRDDQLDGIAEYNNQRVVLAVDGEGSEPSEDEIEDATENIEACSYHIRYSDYSVDVSEYGEQSASDFDSEEELAAVLLDDYVTRYALVDETNGFVGVDVHVGPDGLVYVTQFVC